MQGVDTVRVTAKSPLFAAASCWAALAGVVVLAYAVGPAGRLDADALHGLMALNSPSLSRIGNPFLHSADLLPLMAATAMLFAWGWTVGRRREAFAAVAVVAAANLTGLLLKLVLAHPRFYPVLGTDQVGTDAFPSGHATGAMSIALAATLVAPARIRPAVALGAAAYAFAVSILLLVLSWHLPSDVLGGLLVASSFFFCAVAALRGNGSRVIRHRGRPRERLSVSPAVCGVALALMGGTCVVLLAHSEEVLAFARMYTTAIATAIAVMVVSGGLVASAAIFQR